MYAKRLAGLIAAALIVVAAAAPAANADSISYVKDGNIWLTTSDGARQVQVTTTGGYSFASQADDGTLLGLYGQRLHRLDRAGNVLADFTTPVSDVPRDAAFASMGPIDPQISPDGTKVAYGYHFNYTRHDPYCGYPGGCEWGKVLIGTGYSHADRTTAWDEPGLGRHSGWSYPSWIDNSRVLMSDVAEILNDQVWVDTVGDGQNGTPWFAHSNEPTVRDSEVNRQGDAVATVESSHRADDEIHIYTVNGPIPAARPGWCLEISGDVAYSAPTGYSSPSFSPDGRSVAFDNGIDLFVVRGLDMAGCSGAQSATARPSAPRRRCPSAGRPCGSRSPAASRSPCRAQRAGACR